MLHLLSPDFDPAAIRLIVYDLDGTLVDAFEDIWNGVNHAMRTVGLPELPLAQVRGYVGDGAQMLIRRCLGEKFGDRFAEVFPIFRTFYADNPKPTACLYPGVAETLATLRAQGLRQAVLSNKPHEVTLMTCTNLGLDPLLDAVWGEASDRPRKPAADSLQAVMEQFGVSAPETVMVGDGPADHKVAAAAGVAMIAVTWGLLPHEAAIALRPAALIDQFDDLGELFDGIRA